MGRALELQGARFGRLLVIERAGSLKGRTAFRCRCDCGTEKILASGPLRSGNTTSCGCRLSERGVKHGMHRSSEYRCWKAIHARCTNEKATRFHRYGGRGIKVCARWSSFDAFYADMGQKPDPKLTIERINNDGDYEPGNCCWAPRKRQSNNTCRNVRLSFRGQTLTIAEWAEAMKIDRRTLWFRVQRGWPLERALTVPVHQKNPARPSQRSHAAESVAA